MRWPWNKKTELKSDLVQYQAGVYYIGSSGGDGSQRLKDYVAGYRLCDTVYSCINLIAQSAVLVPWYVYREKSDGDMEEMDGHPLGDWMDKPGPGLDWTEYLTRSFSYYLLTGNAYTRKVFGSFGKYGQVFVLPPQWVTLKSGGDGELAYYELRKRNGQVEQFKADEIMHVKSFNPENPMIGLSPVQVLARKVDISHLGELWTISLLENEARPSGALTLEQGLTPDQRDKLRQDLKDNYQGISNAGRPMILEGKWDWKQFSFTPKELEFLHSKKATMREICAAYKVAPELFGDSENKTYSNIKEARKALYQEAVIPLLGKFKNALNEEIVPYFDKTGSIVLDYDVSSIDALSEDLDAMWTRVLAAKNAGTITRDEAREEIGYGELPGGDTLSEPTGVVSTPVKLLGKEPEKPPVPPQLAPKPKPGDEEEPPPPPKKSRIISVKGGFWQKAEHKREKWESHRRGILARERALDAIAQKYLMGQAERIVKQLNKAGSLSSLDKWGIIDSDTEAGLYADASMPWYVATYRHGVSRGLAAGKGEIFEGEAKGGLWTGAIEAAIRQMILYSGTQIAETTMVMVMELIETAEIESWTVAELAKNIRAKVDDMTPARARRIARTEAVKVENYGQIEGFRESEFVEFKGWLCAFVELSREAHMAADSQYSANPISLDEDFIVGGIPMAYPGDPKGGAAHCVNCLCDIFPQVKEV